MKVEYMKSKSQYQSELLEKRKFRQQMKAELKSLAKQSFLEEFEMWKTTNVLINNNNQLNINDFLEQQQGAISQFSNNVVATMTSVTQQQQYKDMKAMTFPKILNSPTRMHSNNISSSNNNNNNMKLLSSAGGLDPLLQQQQNILTSPVNKPDLLLAGNSTVGFEASTNLALSKSVNNTNTTNTITNNNMYIVSAAPIPGFGSIVQQQMQANTTKNSAPVSNNHTLSLIDQANRLAEMHALFQLPSHLSAEESDEIFRPMELEHYLQTVEAEKQRQRQQMQQQKKKLLVEIEEHRGRLVKARNPPRRFPMEMKPSSHLISPRMQKTINRYTNNNNNNNSHTSQQDNNNSQNHPATSNTSLTLEIHGESVVAGETGKVKSPATSPLKLKAVTLEEFEEKATK